MTAPILAGMIANELNDHLTVILNAIDWDDQDEAEAGVNRCKDLAKRLMSYAHHHGPCIYRGSVENQLERAIEEISAPERWKW